MAGQVRRRDRHEFAAQEDAAMPAPDLMPAPAAPIRWNAADRPADTLGYERPGLALAMTRGALGHCPCCGRGRLFSTWLKQEAACGQCGAPIGLVRADDAPPYFVIFIVAHLVIGTQVLTDVWLNLSLRTEAAIFLPLTLALCLGLLRPVKGATIGLMMQLGMVQPLVTVP
jgi:uncharacterized protein (DUF983 family)